MKVLIVYQFIFVVWVWMKLCVICFINVLKQVVKGFVVKVGKDDEGEQKVLGMVKDRILSYVEQVENQDVMGFEWEVIGFVELGVFKLLFDFISNEIKG